MHKLFKCPSCKHEYEITSYNAAYAEAIVMNCDSCSISLWVDLYDKDTKFGYLANYAEYTPQFIRELEDSLKPCQCGGAFRYGAPLRCKACKETVPIKEIKKQLNYEQKISAPLVVMSHYLESKKDNMWKEP